ncbi:mRNA interferase MazF [Acidaminobacter hydrogenoformans DSM 2784]|uniref:mRNA interferase MazF n=1 Tax=Acidaminobacter hydrogenoformans DSM 2784 TaxID=1120920 RepID=A0A1G5S3Z3_9FIRM|nr:mRNA interferase MazF [Acidaminobacter hydrogenoformans DSM 2784]
MKQGDIIKINFDPQLGHEQSGFRPAVVISNDSFHKYTNLVIACPITTNDRAFPLHLPLDGRTKTTGSILCEQPKTIDLRARPYKIIEALPLDLLKQVIEVVYAEIRIE